MMGIDKKVKELIAAGTPKSVTKDDLKVAVAELKADIFKWVISILLAMVVLIIPLWFKG